jgi:hypothetical protein
MENRYWPLFDLRICSGNVELRPPNDDDLVALAELASKGIHDEATMPFLLALTRATWESRAHPEVEVTGLEQCLEFFLGPGATAN